jgi:hypothetical protein
MLYFFTQKMGLTLFEKTLVKEYVKSENLIYDQSDEDKLSFWNS